MRPPSPFQARDGCGEAVLGAGRWAHRHGGHWGTILVSGAPENKERKMPKTKGAWALTGLGRELINESWDSGGAPMSALPRKADHSQGWC